MQKINAITCPVLIVAVVFECVHGSAVDTTQHGLSTDIIEGLCEGYWPSYDVCLKLGTGPVTFVENETSEVRGCPQYRIDQEWKGRDKLLKKLRLIEVVAASDEAQSVEHDCIPQAEPFVVKTFFRGFSLSRIASGEIVGSAEFADMQPPSHCWPAGFAEHYVEKFDVVPSEQFVKYVEEFDLEHFMNAVDEASSCTKRIKRKAQGMEM